MAHTLLSGVRVVVELELGILSLWDMGFYMDVIMIFNYKGCFHCISEPNRLPTHHICLDHGVKPIREGIFYT